MRMARPEGGIVGSVQLSSVIQLSFSVLFLSFFLFMVVFLTNVRQPTIASFTRGDVYSEDHLLSPLYPQMLLCRMRINFVSRVI